MNCEVPHELWSPPSKKLLRFLKQCEKKFAPTGRLVCPRLCFRSDGSLGVLKPQENISKRLDIDIAKHFTPPLPIFRPSTVKCGSNPPLERSLANECRLLMANHKDVKLDTILAAWEKYMNGEDLPPNLQTLKGIAEKYGYYKDPLASYVGGNISCFQLEDEQYLIHSGLTQISSKDLEKTPMEIGLKFPLDGGKLYQIAKPSKLFENYGEIGKIFATRQLHTTRVWKADPSENGVGQPVISTVQEFCDPNSTVRSIDLNRYIWGELGELRSNKLIISQTGELRYMCKLNEVYNSCMYLNHPKTLFLSKMKSIDLLDTRCSQKEYLQSVFSIEDEVLNTYFNFPLNETIVSFYPSSRDHISYVGTDSLFLVWDIRHGNRPLSKTPHYMNTPPCWISSLQVDVDKEWLFLDSEEPDSSCMLGLTWGSERLCLHESITECFPVSTIEIKTDRLNVLDTLSLIRSKDIGMEWCVTNRFKQARTGTTCERDSDGNVQIWQSTVVGDVYFQQFNLNKKIGYSQHESIEAVLTRLSEWIDDVKQIESLFQAQSNLGQQTNNADFDVSDECCESEVSCDMRRLTCQKIPIPEDSLHLRGKDLIRHNDLGEKENSHQKPISTEEASSTDCDMGTTESDCLSTPKPVNTSTPSNPNLLRSCSSSPDNLKSKFVSIKYLQDRSQSKFVCEKFSYSQSK